MRNIKIGKYILDLEKVSLVYQANTSIVVVIIDGIEKDLRLNKAQYAELQNLLLK